MNTNNSATSFRNSGTGQFRRTTTESTTSNSVTPFRNSGTGQFRREAKTSGSELANAGIEQIATRLVASSITREESNSTLNLRNITRASDKMMQNAIESSDGVLSVSTQRKTREEVREELVETRRKVGQSLDKISGIFGDYYNFCVEISIKVSTSYNDLSDLLQRNSISVDDFEKFDMYLEASTKTLNFQKLVQESLTTVGEKTVHIFTATAAENIEQIFNARKSELEVFMRGLEICHTQEAQVIKNATKIQEMRLQEEEQIFQQFVKLYELQTERDLAERKQAHTETMEHRQMDLAESKQSHDQHLEERRVDLEQMKIEVNDQLERYKTKLEDATKREQAALDHDAQIAELASNERIAGIDAGAKVAEAAVKQPKCTIM